MKKNIISKFLVLFFLLTPVAMLTSCAAFDSENNNYNPVPSNSNNLYIPPGLSKPKAESSLETPTAYKPNNNMQIKQYGSQYWLELNNTTVNGSWLQILQYMKETKLDIKNNDISKGFIQTDWVTMDTDTPKGSPVRDIFSAIGFREMYVLNRSYSFNFMVMPSGNNAIVMVTVYQMNEVFDGCLDDQQMTTINSKMATANQRSTWFNIPPNPQLTVEVLNNLMVYMGGNSVNRKDLIKTMKSAPIQDGKIQIADDYQSVWIRTAIALPNIGLTIRSYDLTKGEFLVFPTSSSSLGAGSKDLAGYAMTKFDNKPHELPMPTYKVQFSNSQFTNKVEITISAIDAKSNRGSFYLNKLALELYQ